MRILYFFLLVAGPSCVWAQLPQGRLDLPPMSNAIPKWEPGKNLVVPGPTVLFPDTASGSGQEIGRLLEKFGAGSAIVSQSDHVIRYMAPDGMPCLVPTMRRVEAMPVDRRRNADRMPNGAGRGH